MPLVEKVHLLFSVGFVLLDLLCVIFCRSLFVRFRLAIVLSVLLFTDADYPFGIYKLFFTCKLTGILKFTLETCLPAVETLGFHVNQEPKSMGHF